MMTTFYLHVVPEWGWSPPGAPKKLTGIKAAKLTQKPPGKIDGVAVKLTIDIEDAAFYPLSPAAEVKIPAKAIEPILVHLDPDTAKMVKEAAGG
jgi:hypothetical protein